VSNAGYTPQDNRADFGQISPLLTILGNVPIILMVLQIILRFFCSVKCVKSDWICSAERWSHPKHESESWCARINVRTLWRLSHETKQYPIRKRADRRRTWFSTKLNGFGQQRWRISLQICGNSTSVYTTCSPSGRHGTHYRSKRLNLGFFVLMFVVSHILKIL